MGQSKPKSIPAIIFSILAITMGIIALSKGMILGKRAGQEMMMMYTFPSVLSAIIAIVIRRNALTILALIGAVLAIVGFVLGS